MRKSIFSLDVEVSGALVRCPAPEQVVVPLEGHSTKTVKKKTEVAPGSLIAEHPGRNMGDAHSPIAGVVAEVGARGVVIKAQEVGVISEPIPTQNLKADELKTALKTLGISTAAYTKAQTLVVNGLNPEPGTAITSYLLRHHKSLIAKGLDAVKNLTGASTCAFVSSKGFKMAFDGCTSVQVPGVYPNSTHPLVAKAATGKELPERTLVVDIPPLYLIGKALETGMPVTEVLVGVGAKMVLAKVGQSVFEVLQAAGEDIDEHDSVILGGPMRGIAVPDLQTGLPKDAYALTVVRAEKFPQSVSKACLNCGECVAHCPARIQPNMIGRFTEFKLYKKTRDYGIDYCFECGLCAYWCTSCRPLLQYIRLAKQELAAEDERLSTCALNE
jgi:Na+-translocating ferredoxin:NAD+ oxidoreductase subunit C